jgi:hypothetical protein
MCSHRSDAWATRTEPTALEIMYRIYIIYFLIVMQLFLSVSNQYKELNLQH